MTPTGPSSRSSASPRGGGKRWRLYDSEHVYELRGDMEGFEWLSTSVHGAEVTPVVRFLDEIDDDDEDEPQSQATRMPNEQETTTRGQVAPLMGLQDQIDLTTFALQIATHYAGSKQRYVIGWAADTEVDAIKAGATTLFTLDEDPAKVQMGEFAQSDLTGFIKSREASLKHGAALSQTPVHELTADIIQMSAEALAAAEAGKERKSQERHTIWGEATEQQMWLAGKYMGIDVPLDSQVVWRDTSARSFAATVDALGKLSSLLGVPPQELWERIPGVTQQDVERYRKAAEQGNAFSQLATMLDQQAAGAPAPANA
ncbi:MAG: phage portal protein [Patulibacter minatonensis]